MAETTQQANGAAPANRRRWLWWGGGALAVLGVLAAASPRALAYRAFHGHGAGPRQAFGATLGHDPAAAKRHVEVALEWALRGVDASETQKEQARRTAGRVIDELAPLVGKHRANTEAMARELAKPEIDKAAIDALRRQQVALADQASTVLVGGVTEIAEGLTPEQRTQLVDFARRFHGGEGLGH